MSLVLTAEDLAVERGGRVLFSGLSFKAGAGEAVTLTGPNGVGKTTLLRALAGFCPITAGSVVLTDQAGDEREMAANCHFIGHANALKSALTVNENAFFWARYLGQNTTKVERVLQRFALAELTHIPAGYLSAGQKRRLALSRLMLAERPVWLLDEPTVSLDAASTAMLASVVNDHVAAGGIVIAATHIPLGLASPNELRLAAAGSASQVEAGVAAIT